MAEPKIHASGAVYASWWSRVGAQLIDAIVVAIPFWFIAIAISTATNASWWFFSILFIVVTAAYDGLLDGGVRGQTLGKIALKIRTMDEATGGPIGYGRGVGRSVFMSALGLPGSVVPVLQLLPLADALWPLADRQRQCWHDKAVGSVVVRIAPEL